ncbi:type I restriction endonuclease subunit R [Desulfonema magnum]|uniref:Endonuclease domain-containing protein n=1 Tax=Desulfonema magnum TaxID=45655 RepID=A0A975BUP0_9BACT|nr:type I restriction endonuclease [Desulfonema magnum]QTA91832.1 Endonuclease domain-containing protein [Desulfonema magnum]
MKTSDTSEKGFQKLIVKELVEKQGYIETKSNDFDREFCVSRAGLSAFVQNSQPHSYDFIRKKGERSFFSRLDSKIQKNGIVEVLRKGLKYFDKTIDLFYPKPNSLHNIKDQQRYEANIFSVTQELYYTADNKNRLDLVIFLNGLPIITLELKNAYTHQAVKNAIRQYKHDRNPKDKIFHFSRCLVHFAADTDLVFMTTHLNGKNTFFMPFNKGLNDGTAFAPFGAGNPVNPEGLKTAYLWEDIFSKESLGNIIEKYAQVLTEKDPDTKKTKKKLIFPRYHQLTVVRKLLAHAKKNSVGNRYLIQHSAGSGKSNSITWLAHQLTGLYDQSNIHPIFDSIVVVTDRTVLDAQIRENIKAFAQVKKIVEAVTGNASDIRALDPCETSFSKTTHMRLALENNKRIIICTVQTFPWVIKAVQEMPAKNIAFLIDEAHSSQSGLAAASMNAFFSDHNILELDKDEEGNISTEDLVNHLIESRRMLKNASYFAFTATPKNKTLETFGCKQTDGTFKAFHTYSMKQAIQEEFILDVLQNYTTYKSYYKIREKGTTPRGNKITRDSIYETQKAYKKLKNFVEGNELAIAEKSRIMIDHFNENVRQLINGSARAMVVTKSIEATMKYKDAFDAYLREIRSPYKAIVAFSGKKAHYKTGEELSEADMNSFPDGNNDIPKQFKKEPYRFLIVANKFQTGFDQPLLHTMYVDKELSGVQAVQTLSRLNRACNPHKTDTFVLDFFNNAEDIQEAFAPFHTTTVLSRETDVNKLNDLQEDLDKKQLYCDDDIDRFFKRFYSKSERSLLDSIIDRVASDFEQKLEQEEQIKFKSDAKSFVRTYAYLSKLLDFNNPYWEKLWLFLKHLVPKLKVENDEPVENILEAVDMDSYRIHKLGTTNISPDEDGNIIEPIPVSTGAGKSEHEYDTLESIISEFNKRVGNIDWGEGVDAREAEQILTGQIPDKLRADLETLQSIKNSDKDNAKITSDDKILELIQMLMFTHTGVYKKFMDDSDFKKQYQEFVFDVLWQEAKQKANAV